MKNKWNIRFSVENDLFRAVTPLYSTVWSAEPAEYCILDMKKLAAFYFIPAVICRLLFCTGQKMSVGYTLANHLVQNFSGLSDKQLMYTQQIYCMSRRFGYLFGSLLLLKYKSYITVTPFIWNIIF